MKIIFLSHTPRNSVFKVGSTHLSRELVKMGHEVLYIPSAVSPFHFLNVPRFSDEDYRKSLKSRINTFKLHQDEENVWNLTPFVLNPFDPSGFTINRMGSQLEKIRFNGVDLVIQDKPGLFFMRKFIQAKTWLYRATDDYSNMPGGPGSDTIQQLEKRICQYADQVIVTSDPLKQIFEERYNTNAIILRNGVDVDHFTAQQPQPAEYKKINRPIILYAGSLDERFDLDLLIKTAEKNTEYQYVIIGPGSKQAVPQKIPNITALGSKPYEQIPAYMQHAGIGLLPLKLTPANHARSPMKMYEYGVCGLPVVSTPLHELTLRKEDFVTFAATPEDFYHEIRRCLEQKERLAALARQQSKNHSWGRIAKQLLHHIQFERA